MTPLPRRTIGAPAWALRLAIVLALPYAAAAPEARAAYAFTRVADTATPAPVSGSPFSMFDDVCYDGQNVAFIARTGNATGPEAIYQWDGAALSRIANSGDTMPSSSSQHFLNFQNLSLDGGRVAFQGSNGTSFDNGTFEGVYTNLGGPVRRVADTTMTMPGSTALFKELAGFGTPSFDVAIDGTSIAFSGFGSQGAVFDEGVYRESGGALSVVANRSTPLPGESEPSTFFRGEIAANGGHVLFWPDAGVFTTQGAPAGQFRKVFSESSSLPGLTSPISIFSPNTFGLDDDGTTAFIASRDSSPYDAYLYIQQPNGVNRKVMDETQTNPVTNNKFTDLSHYYSLSEGRVLFSAWSMFNSDSVDAIYLSNDAGFDPIISDLEALDGKNLTDVRVFKDSLVDRDFVFYATFSDGSSGVYLAKDGPAPPTDTISIEPTFDAQLRPGNQYPLGDGMTTLVIDGGSGSSFPAMQVLAEFPLGQIPDGAHVTAAQLKLDATSASSSLTINALGYAGDGLASLSDEFAATTLLASKPGPFTSAGDITIDLDAAFIESLLDGDDQLGLKLVSATAGPFINFAALEATGKAPTLVVTYESSASSDFDGNGDVDGADFLTWQLGQGAVYDASDLAQWAASFGGPAVATAIPEPAAALLAAYLPAAALALQRRRTRAAQRPAKRA